MTLVTLLGRCEEVLDDLRKLPPSREIAIAITKHEKVIHRLKDRIATEADLALRTGKEVEPWPS